MYDEISYKSHVIQNLYRKFLFNHYPDIYYKKFYGDIFGGQFIRPLGRVRPPVPGVRRVCLSKQTDIKQTGRANKQSGS